MLRKNSHTPWRSVLAFLAVASFLPARTARAEEPSTPPSPGETQPAVPAPTPGELCSAAYERSQTERQAGHYVAATAAALECSQLQCNTAIVRECVRMYESLEKDTPTLVFSARKAEGGELVDVRVEMDGKVAAEQITGRPFAVDPGPHEFVFSHPERGRQRVSQTARVGDHARVLEVTFVDPRAKPAPLLPPVTPDPAPRAKRSSGIPVMTYVLGGVGVVAAGSFFYFRTRGVDAYNEYNTTCSPRCNPGDVDAVRRDFMVSYVSIGVGTAALAGAALIWVLAPSRDSGSDVQASIAAHGDGAMAGLRTRF